MSKKKRGRGRPPKFVGEELEKIVSLLKDQKNAVRTRQILLSRNGVAVKKSEKADAVIRRAFGMKNPVSISMPKLLQVAKKARIRLRRGRPPMVKAA